MADVMGLSTVAEEALFSTIWLWDAVLVRASVEAVDSLASEADWLTAARSPDGPKAAWKTELMQPNALLPGREAP